MSKIISMKAFVPWCYVADTPPGTHEEFRALLGKWRPSALLIAIAQLSVTFGYRQRHSRLFPSLQYAVCLFPAKNNLGFQFSLHSCRARAHQRRGRCLPQAPNKSPCDHTRLAILLSVAGAILSDSCIRAVKDKP